MRTLRRRRSLKWAFLERGAICWKDNTTVWTLTVYNVIQTNKNLQWVCIFKLPLWLYCLSISPVLLHCFYHICIIFQKTLNSLLDLNSGVEAQAHTNRHKHISSSDNSNFSSASESEEQKSPLSITPIALAHAFQYHYPTESRNTLITMKFFQCKWPDRGARRRIMRLRCPLLARRSPAAPGSMFLETNCNSACLRYNGWSKSATKSKNGLEMAWKRKGWLSRATTMGRTGGNWNGFHLDSTHSSIRREE